MTTIKTFLALAAATIATIWGNLHVMAQTLIILMALDTVSGLLSAIANRDSVTSDIYFRGVARKILILILVAGSDLVGNAAGLEPFAGVSLGAGVAGFYVVHELISLLENAISVGAPAPDWLRDILDRVTGAGDTEPDEVG